MLVQREEMKRTAGLEEKTSFVLADAVGVTESLKHVAQPLDRERKIGFERPADEPASVLLDRSHDESAGADTSPGRRGRKRKHSARLELSLLAAREDHPSADASCMMRIIGAG